MTIARRTALIASAAVLAAGITPGVAAAATTGHPAAPAATAGSAAHRELHVGSRGQDVVHVQQYLRKMIPSQLVTGYYGSQTKANVALYQEWIGLPADGIVGPLTWKKIDLGVTAPIRPTLRQGDRGPVVREMQSALKASTPGLQVDGIFGPRTTTALKAYQKKQGLPATGVCARLTWLRLLPSD